MADNHQLWEKLHSQNDLQAYSQESTEFAKEVLREIQPNSKILELGCGEGNDSIEFARSGHIVIATDISNTAIEKNSKKYHHPNLQFQTLDISKQMPFQDKNFDVFYARLSLHYFTDKVTRTIFKEISRILKSQGYLCFMCRSTEDKRFGKGRKLEENMFENNGRVRHFFSKNYIQSLLKENFIIEFCKNENSNLYGSESSIIKIMAKKI